MKVLIISWLLVAGIAVQAQDGVPADALAFARGAVIVSDDGPVAGRLHLPQDVYEWVVRADLGDLRVLNALGEEVPYVVSRPQSKDEHSPWMKLPVFVLPAAPGGTRSGAEVNVEVDDAGTVIAIRGDQTGSSSRGAVLVDASGFKGRPSELRLDWESAGEDLLARVRIEASDDLNSWRTLVDSVAVASLGADGQRVRIDRLTLPGSAARYLKITQTEGSPALAIVSAELRSRRAQLPERQWKTLPGRRLEGGFEFTTDGRFPFDRIALAADRNSYLVTGALYSRASVEAPWRSRGTHVFYRTVVNGRTAAADPIALSGRDQHWRLEIDGAGDLVPALRIGWMPDSLAFVAQGGGPFLLVYGRAGLEGRQWPVRDLLSSLGLEVALDELPLAAVGQPMLLGGPSRLLAAAEPVDWQTVVLWGVLTLGVLLVAGFAWRLLKS